MSTTTTRKRPARHPKPEVQRDLYAEVTDTIVAALENAGQWHRPWTEVTGTVLAPVSVDGRAYRGVNVILLWASSMANGYDTGLWGTYKAWASHGAQVRKGEKGTLVTLWKPIKVKAAEGQKADKDGKRQALLLRHYTVFNIAQVDGYTPPATKEVTEVDPIAHAEEFFDGVGAHVEHGHGEAYYTPALDVIALPDRNAFDTAEHYYATRAHETVHWTGHTSRLDRQLNQTRFGNDAYAFEELIAELGAAFVGAHLGIGTIVRESHAAYVKNWVRVLKDDKKAIFTAASAAQKATDYLIGLAEPVEQVEQNEEENEEVSA